MAKLILCEYIIKGALTNADIYEPYLSAVEMETSSGMLRAKALGIRNADLIKNNLKAEQISEFRELDYAKIVSKELQPI